MTNIIKRKELIFCLLMITEFSYAFAADHSVFKPEPSTNDVINQILLTKILKLQLYDWSNRNYLQKWSD